MDNYIRYMLPNQVYSIIELFDPIYIILTFIIIFLINIYLKILFLYDNLYEIEKIFHKKCKNIKLMIDSDHSLLYRLNDDILNIENKINETNSKFINNIVERNNRKIYSYINSIEINVDNIFTRLNDTINKLSQIINDIRLIKEDTQILYSELEKHKKELLDNLQLVNSFIENNKKELLDKIDIVDTKVEEVYSDLDSLK